MQNTTNHREHFKTNMPINEGLDQCNREFPQDVIEYQKRVDEILVWLFQKNRHLDSRPQQENLSQLPFDALLDEYSVHERFLTEFYDYGSVVMKCKADGIELRDNSPNLSDEDRDEVGIQMDTMNVCYEKLKILLSDRLNLLKRIIEGLQSDKIARFEEWLTSMEKKISLNSNIGPDCKSLDRQLDEMALFRRDLEQKQHFLEFMSNVIVFDEIADDDSQSGLSKSRESLNSKLENINFRWETICKFVENQTTKLEKARAIWDLLEHEKPRLLNWLAKVNERLAEATKAATEITDPHSESHFVNKLIGQSDKIDLEIKSKQTSYTSLEHKTRSHITAINDNYSMFVIELERSLEEIQEIWNSMLYQKRMLDYHLHAISADTKLTGVSMNEKDQFLDQRNGDNPYRDNQSNSFMRTTNDRLDLDPGASPSGSTDDDLESSLHLYSSNSQAIDYSAGSKFADEPRSDGIGNGLDDCQDDDLSLTSLSASMGIDDLLNKEQSNFTNYVSNIMGNSDLDQPDAVLANDNLDQQRCDVDHHNCRVEEWRQSLESLSTWLKRIESLLGLDETFLGLAIDSSIQSWSQSDPHQQLIILLDIQNQIKTSYQDEFDCLLLQGQQIISDLIPQLDVNAYEANLKEIITDIEVRFRSVKRCLNDRKEELIDKARWDDLAKKLKSSSEILIDQMSNIIPETSIGVDLITLAQQQDELILAESNLNNNVMVQSSIQDAKLFLKMCDTLQQKMGHYHVSSNDDHQHGGQPSLTTSSEDLSFGFRTLDEMWTVLKESKEEIETKLDNLTLHYSDLSRLIADRRERLDEVHKEMHALQQSMQELSKQLQVAEILRSNWGPLDDLSVEQLSEQLEDLKLFRDRMNEFEITYENMNSIIDWMTQSDVPLSEQNLARISELNTIWSLIQVSSEERQKLIEIAFDNQGASEQRFLTKTLEDVPNWERRVAPTKVPYFVDNSSNKTIWDHPKFTNMLNTVNSVQQVVFSAYRTALKLRIVQKVLGIDLLMLDSLKEVLGSFNFNQSNNQSRISISAESLVDVEQVIFLLRAIYTKIQEEEKPQLDVPLSIDLTLNWLLNLYDSTRTGFISILSLKVGLVLMCCATREEKYNFMYDLIANPRTLGVDGRRLGTLFEICMRIPIYLGEGDSFGGTAIIESSIRDCFAKSKFNPDQPNSIDRNDYANWLRSEPQFIIWLPVLHRLLVSENTKHPVKCKLCKAYPMIGLRYRCLKCFNFSICQNCFLTGRHLAEHHNPMSHPMQEYCCPTGSGTKVRDLGKILRNKLRPSR